MRKTLLGIMLLMLHVSLWAVDMPFGKGHIYVRIIDRNAVRIRYCEKSSQPDLPEWVYITDNEVTTDAFSVSVNRKKRTVEVKDGKGEVLFLANEHLLSPANVAGAPTAQARLSFFSPLADKRKEYQFGLGQFQDGYGDVCGLTRRLTQVNTQISVPLLISNLGYGLLWNNYGAVDFNPAKDGVRLERTEEAGPGQLVNVTSTEGGRQEMRSQHVFQGNLVITEEADYSLMLDVGQSMARRHQLSVDGQEVMGIENLWLPPTTSCIVHLKKGTHQLTARLTKDDKPVVYFKKVDAKTVFQSPVAQAVDYTVLVGSPDEIIAAYRRLTGQAPLMPQWALGYIHCRERFHNQHELLDVAGQFRNRSLPVDVMVQDWQYWGNTGWNSMTFDPVAYPSPKEMTDSLHDMNMRLMLSVWSKVDKSSEVGKLMESNGYYIPQTDWVDFFNPKAADEYWSQFSKRLLPLGVDAWWQDATEPENDDLVGRRVRGGTWPGEWVRNAYPLMVNKTVYEGLRRDDAGRRPMILTRSGFPGIQRYGAATWSGDVGNDWTTLRRQITAGLGLQAAGLPWWTYDAGGFFRPANQYADSDYIERMLRWIETSVFLPLMRVHGYMSDTEPWRYGEEAMGVIAECLDLRYRLLPYIYSNAAEVTMRGSTLMRPLVFDFPNDEVALRQTTEFMFGKSLLVCPVTEPGVTEWRVYLPEHEAGWYDFYTGIRYQGGQHVTLPVDLKRIPVFVKAGSILPLGPKRQYALEKSGEPIEIHVYPGKDAVFTLYEDDGVTNGYEKGEFATTLLEWDEGTARLTTHSRQGSYPGMPADRVLNTCIETAGNWCLPLVYDKENTGAHFPKPVMPVADSLTMIRNLPDPLAWAGTDEREKVADFSQWEQRRNEIAAQIQHYGIGEKPQVDAEQVKAHMVGDTLFVDVTVDGKTLTLKSQIHYPKTGKAPYALMIGTSMLSLPRQLFEDRPIATMAFHEDQVNGYSQWREHKDRGEYPFDLLYPELSANGAYSEWAWGFSRLLDGLQQLGEEVTGIDMSHIGVTGCSYAGKMALYCGAFDERVALTIAQEPGGGGAAAWRISHQLDSVESLEKTDYHWFLESMRDNFSGDNVYRLPYDHHELCALVCPRALLILGNPDYKWLADEAGMVSAQEARKVWEYFGIADRMGYSIVNGHPHCRLPEVQFPEVQAFIDKFLLGRPTDTDNVQIAKFNK